MVSNPTVIDLCCGSGGWSAAFVRLGYRAIGFDVRRWKCYPFPGEMVLCDIRDLEGWRFRGATCIVASPPCTEFSQAKWPPVLRPSLELVHACIRFSCDARAPLVLENVHRLQKFLGPARHHFGKWYLWGDGVPTLLPAGPRWKDRSKMHHRSPVLRARVPDELATAVALFHLSRNR